MATGRELVAYAYAKVLMRDPFPPPDAAYIEKLTTIERLKVIFVKVRDRATAIRPTPLSESTDTAEPAPQPTTQPAPETAVANQETDS
jgi:hypothetical protein